MKLQEKVVRVQFFDFLRAFAIFLVIATHYKHSVFPGGSIGVSIFFCLSGYLITSILLKEERMDFSSIWKFLTRRFFRVYPAYVVAVMLNLAILIYTESKLIDEFLEVLPSLLTFTYQRNGRTWLGMGVGVFWTLKIEFWFYVLMPFFMLIFGRGKLFAIAVVALWFALVVYQFSADRVFFMAWANNLLIGTMLAIFTSQGSIRLLEGSYKSASLICFSILFLIAFLIPNDDRRFVWPLEALIACGVTAIWMASFLSNSSVLQLPALAWLGRISYSVYLLHAIPLDYLGVIPLFSSRLSAFLVSLLCAVILHYLVEKPFMALAKKLTSSTANEKGLVHPARPL